MKTCFRYKCIFKSDTRLVTVSFYYALQKDSLRITCDLHPADVSKNSSFPVHTGAAAVAAEVPPSPVQFALLPFDVPAMKGTTSRTGLY